MGKRMYEKDSEIRSMIDFAERGNQWFIWDNKTTHRAFLVSLQYRVLENIILSGRLFAARKVADNE